MIDWNNNGIIDPVDVGISIAISQETEQEKEIASEKKEPSLFERIKSWLYKRENGMTSSEGKNYGQTKSRQNQSE